MRARLLAIPGECAFELSHLSKHDLSVIDRIVRDSMTAAADVQPALSYRPRRAGPAGLAPASAAVAVDRAPRPPAARGRGASRPSSALAIPARDRRRDQRSPLERVTVRKAARVGCTTLPTGATASYVANEPAPILTLLPTDDSCRTYIVSDLEPIFDDSPAVAGILSTAADETGRNTIRRRRFPGGSLKIVAARSPRNLRAHTVRSAVEPASALPLPACRPFPRISTRESSCKCWRTGSLPTSRRMRSSPAGRPPSPPPAPSSIISWRNFDGRDLARFRDLTLKGLFRPKSPVQRSLCRYTDLIQPSGNPPIPVARRH